MSNLPPPLTDDELTKLVELADEIDDMLPVRLFEDQGTTILRDRHGAVVADTLSGPSVGHRGHYIAFDRYMRDAMNKSPSLVAELQTLRAALTKFGEDYDAFKNRIAVLEDALVTVRTFATVHDYLLPMQDIARAIDTVLPAVLVCGGDEPEPTS